MVCIFLIHSCLPSTHYAYPKKKEIIITNQHLFLYLSISLTSSLPQQHIYTYIKCTYVLTYLCLYVAYVYEGLYNFEDSTKTMPRFLFFLFFWFLFKKKKVEKKQAEKKWIRRNIWRNDWLKRKHEECSFCLDCDKFCVCICVYV